MKRAGTIAGLIALMLLTACGAQLQQSATTPAGPYAGSIERLWWVMFAITLAVFVIVMGALTAGAWKTKTGTTPPPELHPDEGQEQRRVRIVMVATAITVLVLMGLLIASVWTGKGLTARAKEAPLTIEVIGHQWWWEIQYPSSDPSMHFTTANEIHLPVGVPVVMLSTSRDVIHSFWAPNIQGKRDLIPGQQTALWFRADKEGVYRGQCAEFCGHQHAHMAFHIIVESREKFEQWRNAQVQPAPEPSDPVAQRGKQVFLGGPCVMCHTVRGTTAGSRVGPDLTHLASRKYIAAGTLPNTRGALAGWIADSQAIKPGNRMPPVSLPPEDLQALLTYLETLK